MKIPRKLLSKIAQKILEQIEPLHCDDPEQQKAFNEGHERIMRAARLALEKWVRGG